MLYTCILCVALLMNMFVCCSICELFRDTIRSIFGCGVILLLNIMEVLSVDGGALLDRPCKVFQRMCVLCL